MTDAIQEDVSKSKLQFDDVMDVGQSDADIGDNSSSADDDSPKQEMSARDKALADIARINREEMTAENGDELEQDDSGDSNEPTHTETQAAADDGAETESQAPQPDAQEDPLTELGYYRNAKGELVTKMKINGVEREVLATQVKAHLQKDIAGDWKLQQAAERERRLAEVESLQLQKERQRQSLSQQLPALGADEAKKQAKALLEKIYDGDDSAEETIAKILQRSSATVDPEQLLAEAERRAVSALDAKEAARQQAKWEESVNEGNRRLAADHPEIYADPRLFDAVNRETERIVLDKQSENPDPELVNLTPEQIIVRAAESVQEWMSGLKSGKTPSSGDATARDSRKRNLQRMPRTAQNQRNTRKAPEQDNSPSAVISRMAQGRIGVS